MKKEFTLSQRLTRYLKSQYPRWVPSIELQKLTMEHAGQTGRTCVRRCQELASEGILEAKYVKGAAQYRYKLLIQRPMSEEELERIYQAL